MSGTLKWAVWFILCVILQSALVPHIAIAGVGPDLPLLMLFYLSLRAGMMPGVYVGFFLGLGQDLFAAELLGQNALAKSVTGFVCGIFNERVMRLDPVTRMLLLVVAFLINDIIIMSVHIVKAGGTFGALPMELLVATLPRAGYTLLIAAVAFIWMTFIKPSQLTD